MATQNDRSNQTSARVTTRTSGLHLAIFATMAFALFVMVTEPGGRVLSVLAFFVFVAAAASLIYNMRQGPPSDSDEDDGAVV